MLNYHIIMEEAGYFQNFHENIQINFFKIKYRNFSETLEKVCVVPTNKFCRIIAFLEP